MQGEMRSKDLKMPLFRTLVLSLPFKVGQKTHEAENIY